MAEKPQYRRHALDRVLQRRGRLDPGGAKRRADVDQIAQHLELHRRAAAAMPAIGPDLLRQLALQCSQDPRDPSVRPADRNEAAEQPLQCAQLCRAGAFPGRGAPQMAQLCRQARQHRPPQWPVGVAAGELVEMHDPGVDAGRQHVRAPADRVPCPALVEPAVDQRPGGLAGLVAGAGQIGQPAEPVPRREPFRAGGRRKPCRGGIAYQFAGEFDVAGEDRGAAFRFARPTLADTAAQILRRSADQRVTIEGAGGQGADRMAPQPGEESGCVAASGLPCGRQLDHAVW